MDLGIFDSNKFTLQELTAAVNEAPAVPSRLATLGLFQEDGVATTTVVVEKDTDTLTLLPNTSRSASVLPTTGGSTRKVVLFGTTHLPTLDTIGADDIQNLRTFGTASEEETMRSFVDKRIAKMRRRIDATIEYQRVGAIKGTIIDSDGSTVIENLFTKFELAQSTSELSLDHIGNDADSEATPPVEAAPPADIRGEVLAALDIMEAKLGNEPYTGVRVLCGKTFFRKLIAHPSVKKAYELFESGLFLRNDPRKGFEFAGATWEEYRGAVGGTPFIANGEAYLFPEGVEDMFITRFAPANYVETANTIGLPYYAKQEVKPLGKGVDIEVQSNPISLCTRPTAVVKLTIKALQG
ncbi:major capsid protein [Castellaniella sp. S9]|uniref:major capsid protein n=1 Tax=Castellaniella sp. S9 TaxID=2993652 RepID=UPI0022B54967|nr:major capsid protein [Castellaniella sp. S9]